MTQGIDPIAIKQTEHKSWTNVAPGWRKHDDLLVKDAGAVNERMIELGGIKAGDSVLDIACGTGEPALAIAKVVGRLGKVVAIDSVHEMLDFSKEKAERQGLMNVEFRNVDGEEIDFVDNTFDAVTNRWGLIYMPDPLGAMRRAHRVLKDGARVVVATWSPPPENPWASVALGVLKQYVDMPTPPPGMPGLFSSADEERLKSVFEEAGFKNIVIERVKIYMADHDTGMEYFTYIRELAGPIANFYAQVPDDKKALVDQEIAKKAEEVGGGRAKLQGISLVAVGTK